MSKITKLPPPKIIRGESCGTCKFYEPIDTKGGTCLRYPAQIVVRTTPQGQTPQCVKVGVPATDWCGEYKVKISVK